MKSVIGFVIVAVALLFVGNACLGVSHLEGHMADAQESLATQQYGVATEVLAEASTLADHGRWVPWLGRDERQEIRARAAAARYWQKEYEAVMPQDGAVASGDETNVDLQLVMANAGFRAGQAQWKDRFTTMKTLDEAASRYLTVLKNNAWHPDAAFNYEYVVHLRDELEKNRPIPPPREHGDTENGKSGAPPPTVKSRSFEIYIPLEKGDKNPLGGEAGKIAPKDRKG